MPERTRTAGILALILALTAYAYQPLLSAGLLGDDYRMLLAVEQTVEAPSLEALYRLPGVEGRPLAAASLLASRQVWAGGGRWTGSQALVLRLEHLLLLLLCAWGAGDLLRRALVPWKGADAARAAGHAGAALILLHPLCVAAVARLASRGDLLALALGAWAGRLFLAGRQERRLDRVATAALLTVLAGPCSPIAIFLPLLLGGLEYLSARRHRPRTTRLRTAATTVVVFGALALAEWVGRLAHAPEGARGFQPLPGEGASLAMGLEKLGVLMLPVDTEGIGQAGYILAALLVLVGLHPGFVAARAAPRLWGRILMGWGLSIAVVLTPEAHLRVVPGSLEQAHVLLSAALIMAVGLGISGTALSGWRRSVVPALVGGLFAILGRAVALPHLDAAAELARLRGDLVQAADERGWNATLLVLDPPRRVAGVDVLGQGLGALLALPFRPPDGTAREGRVEVRGISSPAFRAWLREEEFTLRRAGGLTVVLEGALLGRDPQDGRLAIDLPAPGAGEVRATWRGEGRTPPGTMLDALGARSFRVSALPDASTDVPPVIRWTAAGEVGSDQEVTGVWMSGEGSAVAVFDMGSSLPWLFAGRIRSTWFPGPLTAIATAQVTPDPRALPGEAVPRPVGEDWLFDLGATAPLPGPLHSRAEWVLGLLDLARLTYRELGPTLEGGRLRFVGAAAWVEDIVGPVVWYLDRRVEGVTVARATSRRTPRPTAGEPGAGAPRVDGQEE